jgi:hypothetical protein
MFSSYPRESACICGSQGFRESAACGAVIPGGESRFLAGFAKNLNQTRAGQPLPHSRSFTFIHGQQCLALFVFIRG